MTSPEISVIVPTHNRCGLLTDLLGGLAIQTLPADRWELIVVDDASSDGTRQMLVERLAHWPTACRLLSGKHANPAAVRNAGAAASRGSILVFVDDDMTVEAGFVEAHRRAHVAPGMAVIGRLAAPATRRDPWTKWDDVQLAQLADELGSGGQVLGPRAFYSGNCSVDAAMFGAVGGYNTAIGRGEDFDIAYRLARAGARFAYSAEAVSVHHGAHSFARWVHNAEAFGRAEVGLAGEFGHGADFADWFRGRHPLNRMLVKFCDHCPQLRAPIVASIDAVGRASYALGGTRMAVAAYSAIYNLAYWHGLIDTLGSDRFWREARSLPRAVSVPASH